MISLYKCEKCGKIFEDYSEASKCEDGHLKPDWWATQDRWATAAEAEYAHGGRLPKTLEIISEVQYYDYDQETQQWKKRRIAGTYKLMDTAEEPITDEKE